MRGYVLVNFCLLLLFKWLVLVLGGACLGCVCCILLVLLPFGLRGVGNVFSGSLIAC